MNTIVHTKRIRTAFAAIVCCFVSIALAQQKVTIHFANKVGDKNLQLVTETYENSFGETFTVNMFKYYISKIVLVDADTKHYAFPNDYYLVDEADSTSKTITLTTSAKRINDIQFLIGVDSIKNVSGTQTGSLDPMNGMFWTWNTGYVFAKLQGVSSAAKVAGNQFSWHVGGFKTGENALKFIRLNVGQNIKTKDLVINIEADLNQWFGAKNKLKISEHPICHSPGELAKRFADNYTNMFSISTTN